MGSRGFTQQRGAVTAPSLAAQRGVLRSILAALDLQSGIRYGGQLQSAKMFVLALERLLAQLAASSPQLAKGLQQSAPNAPPAGAGKRGARRALAAARAKRGGMTKREQRAAVELSREGWVGQGAVDPSPQRSAVAVAACLSLLLESPGGAAASSSTSSRVG